MTLKILINKVKWEKYNYLQIIYNIIYGIIIL